MKRQLLTTREVIQRLKVSRATFYRHRPRLIALGLQAVRIGTLIRYKEASLEKVIEKAMSEF